MSALKRSLSFLLSLVLVFSMLPGVTMAEETAAEETVQATGSVQEETTTETEPEAALWEYETYGDGIVLTSYNGASTDVYVPSKVDDQTVIKLGDSLFYDNDGLNSVTLGAGILEIGEKSFYDCDNMVCILISEELTTLGAQAFYSCDSFNSVILYDAVTAIGENAFAQCPKLTIWCNESTAGHSYATENAIPYEILNPNAQPETYIQNGITYYIMNGEAAAIDFDESATEVEIPSTVAECPVTKLYATFEDCTKLQSVIMPETLKYIGVDTFYNCSALQNITIPDGVTIIEENAFRNCKALKSLTIPKSVVSIGSAAFHSCTALESVTILDGLTAIGSSAFAGCTMLQTINIPASVTSIGEGTFSRCSSLQSIIIPDGITKISSSMFSECTSLQSVTIPENVTAIGNHAFRSCSSLQSITIPDGTTEIGYNAFEGCSSLESVTIPENVTSIGSYAFYGCSSLKSARVNGTMIGFRMFDGCTALENVIISEGVTLIEQVAFDDCPSLQMVIIPASVTSMYTNSFPATTVLLVYENSYAHTFAEENDLLYFVLRKTENPEIAYGAGVSGTVAYTDGTAAGGAVVEILYEDGTLKESVIADENGSYSFTYAEVGAYTVRATDASGNTAASGVSVKRMNVFEVFLAGDTALTLKQGWTVSGTVSEGTATVTVTDTDGNVLESMGATDGSFAFTNIPNGTYIIKAETENGCVSQEITVFNADLSGITLTVAVETVALWGYVEVEDRNYDHHRRNWVQVTVYDAEGVAVGQSRSDSDGVYRFAGLPVGVYSIVAETAELRPDKKHGYDRNHTLTGYAYVDAAAAGEYQADTIVLYEENDSKATISGKVTAQAEAQSCQVVLRNVFRHEVASMTTGNNGKYSFTNIRDGLYFITATTQSNGMGFTVVAVRNGRVYGETDITVYKTDKIKDREDRFKNDVPECESREDAVKHRDRIAEEKRCYDALSEKEKKQLSKDYVERLNRYCEWIANTEYQTDEGVTVEQGGLVISGDELENEDTVCFNLTVEKTEGHTPSTDGVHNRNDQIHHDMHDAAGKGEIRQYYEVTMTKTVDGTEKNITSVSKDTDAMGKFRITMEIPEEYRGHKHYTMVHVHNGETVTLADLDDDPNTITFEVDKFSTYALVSADEALTSEDVAEVYTGTTLAGSYATVEEALMGYDPACQYIKLTADTEEVLTLTGDLYIDLNGYTLGGTVTTNGYSIYGMDSTTDKYTCDTMGYFNCVDENGNAVVPASNVKTNVTGSVRRYLSIKTDNGYTFHRFYLGVTHSSLKPGVGGVGYKAVFAGDEMVQSVVDAYGYSLQLKSFAPVTTENTGSPISGKTFTVRVENFDVDTYGETDLTAQVYIVVDGETIYASAYTTTVKAMVQAVDANASAYTVTQLDALQAWLSKFEITESWI